MKNNKKFYTIYGKHLMLFRWLFFALAVLVMIVIFVLSSQTATVSSKTSSEFIEKNLEIFVKDFKSYSETKKTAMIHSLQFSVRKAAHFSIFAALGALLFSFYSTFKKNGKCIFIYSFITSFLYSVFDEIKQLFIKGRSGEIRDVCIDSSGAILGILFALFVIFLILKKQENRGFCCEKK